MAKYPEFDPVARLYKSISIIRAKRRSAIESEAKETASFLAAYRSTLPDT